MQLRDAVGEDECAREAKLGGIIEKSRATLLLHRFFTEGKVASQASLQPCNDSEYIGRFLLLSDYYVVLDSFVTLLVCKQELC